VAKTEVNPIHIRDLFLCADFLVIPSDLVINIFCSGNPKVI
jgi:hypothetical protein